MWVWLCGWVVGWVVCLFPLQVKVICGINLSLVEEDMVKGLHHMNVKMR